MTSLFTELKRRNVFRVGVAYAIVGWLLIEVASVLLPTFKTPEWVMQAFSSLVILGFPLALIFALTFPHNSCPGRMLRFVAGWEEGEADEVQATQRRTDHLQAA